MADLSTRRKRRQDYEHAAKTTPVGEGSRFKALSESAEAGGAKEGNAVAGKIFWEKYGKKRGSAILRKAR